MAAIGDIIDNPTTGQSLQYDGKGWVPYYDKGLEPATPAESFSMGATQILSAPARAVAKVGNLIAGRNLLPGQQLDTTPAYTREMETNPGAALAGQITGSVPAMVATGIAGAMAPATIAAQAPIMAGAGALLEPEHPMRGALMGVAGVLGGTALGKVLESTGGATAIVAKVRDMMPFKGAKTQAGVDRRNAAALAADQAEGARLAAVIPEAPPAPTMGGAPATGPAGAPIVPAGPAPMARQMEQPGTVAGPPGAPPGGGGTLLGNAGRGDRPETRMLPGYMLPEELAAIGIPRVTPAHAEALYARTPEALSKAKIRMDEEELASRGGPIRGMLSGGRVTNDIREQQLEGLTNYVKREMGIPATDARMLTPTRVSEHFEELGNRFQRVMGEVKIQPDQVQTLRGKIGGVLEGATSESEKMVNGFLKRFEFDTAGGRLSNDAMRGLDKYLQKQIGTAQRQGEMAKVADGNALRGALLDIVEDASPPGTREAVQQTRRQYAINASLQGPGRIDPGGIINVASMNNAWNKNKRIAKTALGRDDLGRALETVNFMTSKQTPSSGTTEGVIRALKDQAGRTLLGGIIPGL